MKRPFCLALLVCAPNPPRQMCPCFFHCSGFLCVFYVNWCLTPYCLHVWRQFIYTSLAGVYDPSVNPHANSPPCVVSSIRFLILNFLLSSLVLLVKWVCITLKQQYECSSNQSFFILLIINLIMTYNLITRVTEIPSREVSVIQTLYDYSLF